MIRHLRLDPPQGDMARFEAVFDSPSLSGHMDFRIRSGDDAVADISVTIFPRIDIDDIGIAPLTSMYLKGALRGAVSDDFRPRVHDSDVLFVTNGQGERIWRPISNPALIQTSAFGDVNPKGFGLFQTHRAFPDFQDPEARYHERPSCMVEPLGDWGDGAVVLVEIPTGDEFMDNIVAFWRPAEPLRAGGEYRFDYRVTWTVAPAPQTGAALIVEGRSGREHDKPGTLRYVIDYAGDAEGLSAVVQSSIGDETITGVLALPAPRAGPLPHDLPVHPRRERGRGTPRPASRRGRRAAEPGLAPPLDPRPRRRGLTCVEQDLGGDRAMVRRRLNPRTVDHPRAVDPGGPAREDPVQRQDRAHGRKCHRRRSFKPHPQHGLRQGEPAPWPPFVEVAHQDGRARRAAEQVLADRPHLRDAERLRQGQVRADKADRPALVRDVGDHGAPVAMAGQVEEHEVLEIDRRRKEQDDAKEAVTVLAPPRTGIPVGEAEPCPVLDPADVEHAPVRWHLLVRLLKAQDVRLVAADVPHQHLARAVRVDAAVPAPSAVDVPADAAERVRAIVMRCGEREHAPV